MKGTKSAAAKRTAMPLVSVIVPTLNSQQFLDACLKSIKHQTYKNIEIIVVDNFSTDATEAIAKRYTKHFYTKGPERSAQRNYAVTVARGLFVAIIDSDMKLSSTVIKECVSKFTDTINCKGIIIPEESYGVGFWAKCKKLERSYYIGVDWIEAARFFRRTDYNLLGGYNEKLISGEDWDLSNRARKLGTITRVNSLIYHNEGRIELHKLLKKKAYYAKHIGRYVEQNLDTTSTGKEARNALRRFGLYFSRPSNFILHPLITMGMLFMKTMEYVYGFGSFIGRAK